MYDGFISYSHAADGLLAPRLQAGLQRFAKPWWKRRSVRIFRDESSLSANPHLWSSITDALDSSGWFVLLLSPDAARSEWVNQEIAYWKTNRDPSRILPVVTDGGFGWADGDVTGDSVPDQLAGVFAEEPRWVDLRFAKGEEQLDLKNARFAAAIADIASALRGIPKDELESEEVRQHRRAIRTAWAAGGLVTVLAIAAAGFGIQSARNADEAERQTLIAEANAEAEAVARAQAETNARLATTRELAASAIAAVDADPRLASWLALVAIAEAPDDDVPPVEVVNALWRAVGSDPHVAAIDLGFGGNTFVGLSPDDTTLAVSSAEGARLELRDAETFEVLWVYSEETEDGFARPVFSPDGSMIAIDVMGSTAEDAWRQSGEDDLPNRVLVLDASSGEVVRVLEFPECDNVWAPEWSPDGRLLVVSPGFTGGCQRDGIDHPIWMELFDTATWSSRGVISIEGDDYAVRGIFLSDDRLGAFRSHNPLEVYDPNTLELVEVFSEVRNPVTPGVSPAGGLIAAHSNETLLGYLHDLATGRQLDVLGQLEAWPTIPYGVSITDDGGRVAFATDGRILVWDTATGEQIYRLTAGAGSTNTAFSKDGSRLYSAHRDGAVRVWDLQAGSSIVDSAASFPDGSFVNGNSFFVGTGIGTTVRFEFVPDFVTYAEFFDTETGALVAPSLMTDRIFALLPNDLVVAQLPGASRYVLFDPFSGEAEAIGPECPDFVCVALLSADRDRFAIVREVGGALEWNFFDSETAEPVGRELHDAPPRLADGFGSDWVLTSDRDGGASAFIDRSSSEEVFRPPSSSGTPAFSNDGSTVAIRLGDGAIMLIDTDSWDTTVLDLGFGRVRGLAFGPQDSRLAVADEDEILVVDLEREEVVQQVPIPLVSDIHWIDESTLLVGDRSGAIWGRVSLDISDLIERARHAVADRPLTAQECTTYRIEPCPTLEEMRGG